MVAFTYNFRAPMAETVFDLKPEAALNAFRAKGLKPTFAWQDMLGDEHARAFTVAKMMDVDLLDDTRQLLDRAIDEGMNLRWFKDNLISELQAKGWWGKKGMIDPLTGNPVMAQLGSSRRLETIFRTNMQTGYSIGSWEGIQQAKEAMPYLMYDALDDHRTRPEHAAWDNLILPVDDPWWDTHHPTNGWNCRCGTIQYSKKQLDRAGKTVDKSPKMEHYTWENPRTGDVRRVPEGLDPGWDHNAGKDSYAKIKDVMAEKIAALPAEYQAAVRDSWVLGEEAIIAANTSAADVTPIAAVVHRRNAQVAATAETKAIEAARIEAIQEASKNATATVIAIETLAADDPGGYLLAGLVKLAADMPGWKARLSPIDALAQIARNAEDLRGK